MISSISMSKIITTLMNIVCILLLGILNFSCAKPAVDYSFDDYSIYSEFLQDDYNDTNKLQTKKKQKINKAVVIMSETKVFKIMPNDLKANLKGLQDETIQNYIIRNKTTMTLENKFRCEMKIILVKESKIKKILKKGWSNFKKKYPYSSGFIFLSRVGFNKDKTQALIYVGELWGPLAGVGYYILYNLENGEWISKASFMVWIV